MAVVSLSNEVFMLFKASRPARLLGRSLLTGLFLSIAAGTVDAQILLRPGVERIGAERNSAERSFEKPVSREVEPIPTEPLQFGSARSSATRDSEFVQLQQEAESLERQLGLVRRIVKFAAPSIVHIEASKKSDPGKGFASSRVEEAGAGVIIDLAGSQYVLTNRHVIFPAETTAILIETSDGQQMRPLRVWTDASTDVAVMLIRWNNLTSARLGNSDNTDIGDFVLAVGSPFGLSHSVTYGIISAKGRRNLELGSKEIEIQDFFQTDAAINPGNSGGPLLNLRGEVVGINTAIASNSGGNEGIGFSIPINMAVTVAEQLVSRGKLLRSYLGVQLENSFDAQTAQRLGLQSTAGALVKSIIPNSPAQRAGLQVGDVITEFNGIRIENDGHLVKTVGLTPVGRTVQVVFYREGAKSRAHATLDANPDQ